MIKTSGYDGTTRHETDTLHVKLLLLGTSLYRLLFLR